MQALVLSMATLIGALKWTAQDDKGRLEPTPTRSCKGPQNTSTQRLWRIFPHGAIAVPSDTNWKESQIGTIQLLSVMKACASRSSKSCVDTQKAVRKRGLKLRQI
eukprot:5285992-Amphidinium_carterae.1